MPDKLFRGDITNSVAELTLLDEEVIGPAGTSSYRLGNTNNGEILTVSKGDFPDYTLGSNPYYVDANFKGLVIGTSCTSIGSGAFFSCYGLVGSLVIPDSVTTIGDYAFSEVNGFGMNGTLTIGNSVTSIGNYAFYNCDQLTGSLTIPDSVTSIGIYAFGILLGLTGSLTIGNSVTSIGSQAFYYCSGLTALYTNTPAASWVGTDALLNTPALVNIYYGPNTNDGAGYSATFQGGSGMTVLPWNNYPNPIPN